MNFYELGLNQGILRTLEEIGLTVPTPIQIQAIPPVLEGRDVVGLAQTGTGKTAAFLLPLLQHQMRDNYKGKFRPIRVLILSPTRELAAQIYEKAREYGKSLNLRSQCTVGGIPINRQQRSLERGADILIATPGRLLDLAKRNAIGFDKVQSVVLDEADHMLDIGFLPDIRRIFSQLPNHRQTLLFSATMPTPIRELAEQYLHEPVQISVAREASVADNINQSVIHLSARQKPDGLASLLQEFSDKRVVVFARTKHGSDKIVRRLQAHEINAAAIHGNKSQGQRERTLKAFTNGDCKILIATDIAARGIDIKDVGLVVNYELPPVPEVYVHRIGRTARAGSSGVAVAFCAPDEIKHLRGIEKLIQMKIPSEGQIIEPQEEVGEKSQKRRFRKRSKPNNLPTQKPGSKVRKSRRSAKKRQTELTSKKTVGSIQPHKTNPLKDRPHGDQSGSARSKSRRSFKRRKSKPI
ncbi:MAG: DEAD/DEAH box helicase [Pseudomonadota bacterium]